MTLTPTERTVLNTLSQGPLPVVAFRGATLERMEVRGLVRIYRGGDKRFWVDALPHQPRHRAAKVKPVRVVSEPKRRGPRKKEPWEPRRKNKTSAGPQNLDRWAYAKSLRDAGHTLKEIGSLFGVSRERVRQKLGKGKRAANVDPIALMAALRAPTGTSYLAISKTLGTYHAKTSKCAKAMGVHPAAVRLFRWRREAPTRRKYASAILREAERLGRTPTFNELGIAFGWPPLHAPGRLTAIFHFRGKGGLARMWRYLGLTPNPLGSPGHKHLKATKWFLDHHCGKGHQKRQSKSGVWYCSECRQIARQAARASLTTSVHE